MPAKHCVIYVIWFDSNALRNIINSIMKITEIRTIIENIFVEIENKIEKRGKRKFWKRC